MYNQLVDQLNIFSPSLSHKRTHDICKVLISEFNV